MATSSRSTDLSRQTPPPTRCWWLPLTGGVAGNLGRPVSSRVGNLGERAGYHGWEIAAGARIGAIGASVSINGQSGRDAPDCSGWPSQG